jgi:hypothetical protein
MTGERTTTAGTASRRSSQRFQLGSDLGSDLVSDLDAGFSIDGFHFFGVDLYEKP